MCRILPGNFEKASVVSFCVIALGVAKSSFAAEAASGANSPGNAPAYAATADGVVVLPKVVVNGTDIFKFEEKQVFDEQSFNQLLAKRFPGMTLRDQPREVDNYGLLAYRDEKRLEAKAHFENLANVLRTTGNTAEARELQDEIDRSFIRRPSWREAAMDRNINSNRR